MDIYTFFAALILFLSLFCNVCLYFRMKKMEEKSKQLQINGKDPISIDSDDTKKIIASRDGLTSHDAAAASENQCKAFDPSEGGRSSKPHSVNSLSQDWATNISELNNGLDKDTPNENENDPKNAESFRTEELKNERDEDKSTIADEANHSLAKNPANVPTLLGNQIKNAKDSKGLNPRPDPNSNSSIDEEKTRVDPSLDGDPLPKSEDGQNLSNLDEMQTDEIEMALLVVHPHSEVKNGQTLPNQGNSSNENQAAAPNPRPNRRRIVEICRRCQKSIRICECIDGNTDRAFNHHPDQNMRYSARAFNDDPAV